MSDIIVTGYSSVAKADPTDELRLLVPQPLARNNWKIARWWQPVVPTTRRSCARVDVHSGGGAVPTASIYIDGTPALKVTITFNAGAVNFSELRGIDRILVCTPGDEIKIANQTIVNYDDYDWDSSIDKLVKYTYGTGAPV